MTDKEIAILIVAILFLAACAYVLFFWKDPAIERYERGEAEALRKQSINQRNEMAVAMRAFTTGKSCIGEVDDDGELKITVLEDE